MKKTASSAYSEVHTPFAWPGSRESRPSSTAIAMSCCRGSIARMKRKGDRGPLSQAAEVTDAVANHTVKNFIPSLVGAHGVLAGRHR
jgi:hypothetical protein